MLRAHRRVQCQDGGAGEALPGMDQTAQTEAGSAVKNEETLPYVPPVGRRLANGEHHKVCARHESEGYAKGPIGSVL